MTAVELKKYLSELIDRNRDEIIRSGEALETLHKVDSVVMDKTGTLTEGKLFVT